MTAAPRRILVTGASRGIGRAIARAFAARGDRVAVHYGSSETDAVATLRSLAGSGHAIIAGDLAIPGESVRIVDAAITALGGLDVLVNNAAVAPSPANLHRIGEVSLADWQRAWREALDVNVLGAADASWALAQHLIARGAPGAIVNVGSRGAYRGEPDYPAYGASKAALHALGQSLAVALAPHGIAVASVAPGFVGTERQAAKLAGDSGDAVREQSPFGAVATPEQVASAVVYLASPEAVWSSGAVLDVNGASYLR